MTDSHRSRLATTLSFIKECLHPDSMRGRYLLGSILFVCLLIIAASFAHRTVTKAASMSDSNILQRELVRSMLTDITNEIWVTETSLQAFSLNPDKGNREKVIFNLDDLVEDMPALLQTQVISGHSTNREIAEQLGKDIIELRKAALMFMDTRTTVQDLYPASRIMFEKMLPMNIEFSTAANLAIEDARALRDQAAQNQIYERFFETRYAWNQMIGAFRNLVANRFGIFGNPQSGMRSQAINIKNYSDLVAYHLGELQQYYDRGELELQQEESVEKMRSILPNWIRSYKKAVAILSSENWRTDIPLMRNTIRPLFASLWSGIRTLDNNLVSLSGDDIDALTNTADGLSRSIWALAILGALVTMVGFFFYEKTILVPITRVIDGLKAEADGVSGPPMDPPVTLEGRNLMTAFDNMRQQVRSRQQRLQAIFDNAAEGIITIDEHGNVESFNAAAEQLFGYSQDEIVGNNISILMPEETARQHNNFMNNYAATGTSDFINNEREVIARRADGSEIPISIKVSEIEVNGRKMYSSLVADISERKALMENLKSIAERDTLTGLSNRYHFQIELERVVHELARNPEQQCALLYIDLDNFKYINDTMGHAAGDRLLNEVADNLNRRTRKSDLIARFGGDEFTLLIYDTNMDIANRVAESYRSRLADYIFMYQGKQADVGCSIGVAMITSDITSADEVMSRADFACHLAKRSGRNRVHMFNPDSEVAMLSMSADMSWSRKIKDALENDLFVFHYQPIIDARSGEAVCFEILLRMIGDDDEIIMPSGFIGAAERFGLASEMDRWVFYNAIKILSEKRHSNPGLKFSINISATSVSDSGLLDFIESTIRDYNIERGSIIVEVTETAAIADLVQARDFLGRLRHVGCLTALDDFGTGMASLSYLQDLPVDIVKIDGRFVRNLGSNPVDVALVRAMVDIASTLECKTVAECVENNETLEILRTLNVEFVQGYYLQKPAPAPLYIVQNSRKKDSA